MKFISNPEKEIPFYIFSKGFDLTNSIANKYSTDFMPEKGQSSDQNLLSNYQKNVLPFSTVYDCSFEKLPIPKYYSWNLWKKIYNE